MAHFAKLDENNNVIGIHVLHNDVLLDNGKESEQKGIDFLTNLHKHIKWKQTSCNTRGNVHILGGTPFRKNFAVVCFYYDEDLDYFIYPSPFPSWILNTETCIYEAPVKRPNDNNDYNWNENTNSWDLNE